MSSLVLSLILWNFLKFLSLTFMLTINFHYIALMEIMNVAVFPEISKNFNKKAFDFGKDFLSFLWEDYMIIFFHYENMLDYFDGLSYTEPALHP